MQTENNIFLQNQKYSSMIRPTIGASKINPFILDVVEKLGKYALIYDYKVYNPSFMDNIQNINLNQLLSPSSDIKKTLVPENTPPVFYNFLPSESYIQALEMAKREQALALAMQNVAIAPRENMYTGAIMPYVSYTVNPNPQIGYFSKGNVVNVIRFEGNIAVVENPNYVVLDTTAPKVSFWTSLAGNMINQKEFKIPKEYLSKVDDNTPVTVSTGINFGANPKPQPIYNIPSPKLPNYQNIPDPNIDSPFKPKIIPELDNEVVLEKNATFVLNKDLKYRKNSYCPPNAQCMLPPQLTINAGTKVTGKLVRRVLDVKLNSYNLQKGIVDNSNFVTLLVVSTPDGNQNIPFEYLTKEIQNNTSDNSGTIVPVKNNNKNLLLIAGAFLAGYILFSNSKSSN